MRQSMLEVVRQDYIQSGAAKGLAGARRHRQARPSGTPCCHRDDPRVSRLPGLIGGSVIVESIFAIPGHGTGSWCSRSSSANYPVIMGKPRDRLPRSTLGRQPAGRTSAYGLVRIRGIRLGGRRRQ